jgi:hypothetical protein
MKIAKTLVLPVVAVAVISIFCKAQNVAGPKDQSVSAAPSPIVTPAPQSVSIDDLPQYNCTRQCADMINAGLASIGKEETEPRKVHFEFTLTLPANK